MIMLLIFTISIFLLTACGPDMPEGIEAKQWTLLPWSLPDTVEVMTVQNLLDDNPSAGLGPVQRKWLNKHDYVRTSIDMNTTANKQLEKLDKKNEEYIKGFDYAFTLTYVRVD